MNIVVTFTIVADGSGVNDGRPVSQTWTPGISKNLERSWKPLFLSTDESTEASPSPFSRSYGLDLALGQGVGKLASFARSRTDLGGFLNNTDQPVMIEPKRRYDPENTSRLTLPLVLPWYSLQISLTLVAQVLVMVAVSPKLL